MKRSWIIGVVFLFCIVPFVALGANTVVYDGGNSVTVSAIDSDWDYIDTFPDAVNGIRVQSIIFYSDTTDDDIFIRDSGDDSGPIIFPAKIVDGYDQRGWQYDCTKMKPYYDFSVGGAISANAFFTIILCSD